MVNANIEIRHCYDANFKLSFVHYVMVRSIREASKTKSSNTAPMPWKVARGTYCQGRKRKMMKIQGYSKRKNRLQTFISS